MGWWGSAYERGRPAGASMGSAKVVVHGLPQSQMALIACQSRSSVDRRSGQRRGDVIVNRNSA